MRLFVKPTRLLACLLIAGLALAQSSCAVADYGGDRLMDLTDIIDLKYGVGVGVGAKAEVTTYFGAGGGLAALGYTREWFGRRSTIQQAKWFLHFGVAGVDGGRGSLSWDEQEDPDGDHERADVHVLFANITTLNDHATGPRGNQPPSEVNLWGFNAPPTLDRFRIGAEFVIPVIQFGLFVNIGEIVDFVGGFTTWDPAYDDDASFHDVYYDSRVTLEDAPSEDS
ncbi:MAG: hypothetical protein DHS20C15_32740 [Planctomycetota bacterium]|nr:MAG: hypothetical protein DHS20C15_32740 [Planctomycetota bacterium]